MPTLTRRNLESSHPHFAHLHVHSHYSLLRATASVAELLDRAQADGLTHLALTDADVLYGAVAFSRASEHRAITPIIGMTTRVRLPDDRIQYESLVLLATGPAGYRSLCRLSSSLQARPDREAAVKQGLSWEDLADNQAGLICLFGGRGGTITQSILDGDPNGARRHLEQMATLFGERTYVALEIHGRRDEQVAREAADLGARLGLATVAVQPVYSLDVAHLPQLRLMAAIRENCRLDAVPDVELPGRGNPDVDLHWLAPAEMAQRFAAFPDALANIGDVLAQCGPALPDGRPIWPVLPLGEHQNADDALAALAARGLARKYDSENATVRARLQRELAVIEQHGYAPLFLLVADIVRHARSQQIPVSTRGSVANSLVAFCIDITTVDPIVHDLLFERFLNPERTDPPDIDLDFCSRRRDEVLAYVRRTYGEEKVALVATVSTMRPKSAIRETGKAYGLDEADIVALIRLIPDRWHPDPQRRTRGTLAEMLHNVGDPQHRRILAAAYDLVGQPHHLSIHPGGVVVAPGAVTDYAPLQWTPKGFHITQFDHVDVEQLGLPKIDLLGIRALTVLSDAVTLIQQRHPDFRLTDIRLDDGPTGDLLARGETISVFQCESSGAQRTLRQLKARNVRDLAVANAFFKPGPATGGMAQAFIRRYRGEQKARYLHPALETILSPTFGVLLFQEQILRVAHEIAGLSWADADHLRRGMSKFRPDEMASIREKFVAGCQRPPPQGPDFSENQAATLWEQVAAFAGYGFNQGHATAYADVSYRSAYLKTHFVAEFLCARLADRGGFHHPAIYIAEAQRLGLAVRPPHINHSAGKFSLAWADDGEETGASMPVLWMGLGQVRDLRRATTKAIVSARRSGDFRDLRDFAARVDPQPKELDHLIRCGALDGLGPSRAALLAEMDEIRRAGSAQQIGFAFARPETPRETAAARVTWERRLLGQPVSVHPLETIGAGHGLMSLASAVSSRGRVAVVACRLPGWTGDAGFFLGDGETLLIGKTADTGVRKLAVWQPIIARGEWRTDAWGGGWLQIAEIDELGSARSGKEES